MDNKKHQDMNLALLKSLDSMIEEFVGYYKSKDCAADEIIGAIFSALIGCLAKYSCLAAGDEETVYTLIRTHQKYLEEYIDRIRKEIDKIAKEEENE
jgi:hypothetical protein